MRLRGLDGEWETLPLQRDPPHLALQKQQWPWTLSKSFVNSTCVGTAFDFKGACVWLRLCCAVCRTLYAVTQLTHGSGM